MATQLQIVNKVMRRLREQQVTAVNQTEYSVLIADFLNQIIDEVGTEHEWSMDRATVQVTAPSGSSSVSLSEDSPYLNVGSVGVNSNSTPQFTQTERTARNPWGYTLTGLSGPVMRWQLPSDPDTGGFAFFTDTKNLDKVRSSRGVPATSGTIDYFSLAQNPTGWDIEFWPEISRDIVIETYWYIPQAELEVDGTDDSTNIRYNQRVLYLGTLFLALNERGEEIGEPGNVADENYRKALSDAVYNDSLIGQLTNRYEFFRD
jgi:hypothetical protein